MTETVKDTSTTTDAQSVVYLVIFILFYLLIPIFTIIVGFTFLVESNQPAFKFSPSTYNSTAVNSARLGSSVVGLLSLNVCFCCLLIPCLIAGFWFTCLLIYDKRDPNVSGCTSKDKSFCLYLGFLGGVTFLSSFYFINSILLIKAAFGPVAEIRETGVLCLIIGFLTLPVSTMTFLAFIVGGISTGVVVIRYWK